MTQIDLNTGSDLRFEIIWPSGPEEDAPPLDIRGHTLDVIECSEPLLTHMTVNIADGENGQILGKITWDNSFPKGRSMSFILRRNDGEDWSALPRITVNVI